MIDVQNTFLERLPEGLRNCYKTVKMDAGQVPHYQRVCHVQEKTMHLKFFTVVTQNQF